MVTWSTGSVDRWGGGGGVPPELVVGILVVVPAPLGDEPHEVVRDLGADQVAPVVEHGVHGLDEPLVVRGVALGELGDAGDKLGAEELIVGLLEATKNGGGNLKKEPKKENSSK
jgi:hypothetical protein